MELRSCYFCGTGGDALDTHDVGTDAAVRITLCPDCHGKLGRVLDAVGDDGGDRGFDAAGEVTFDDETRSAPATTDTEDATPSASDADSTPAGPTDEGGNRNAGAADARDGDGSSDDGDTDESGGRPHGLNTGAGGDIDTYRKALRMLRNREFPMERTAVVDLLSTAYDLDRDECDEVIDFAVDRGLLAEDGSELRRP